MILNIKGKLKVMKKPLVMGIVNLTEDSFYAGSRVSSDKVADRVGNMIEHGADIIDLGACSTRPGSEATSEKSETSALLSAIENIRSVFPDVVISADTYRSAVAKKCVEAGADIVNDISGGDLDPKMFETIASLKVPYIISHLRGTPADMQSRTDYEDVGAEVLRDLAFKADTLHQMGVCDVIVDPGFGFAKTLDQNYHLLALLGAFKSIGCPILAGLSRKSMIYKELGITPDQSLNGTTALNMIALLNGADILRVHDVMEASETVRLFEAYSRNIPERHSIVTYDKDGRKNLNII